MSETQGRDEEVAKRMEVEPLTVTNSSPRSSLRRRLDGGADWTWRINFLDALDSSQLRRIVHLLTSFVDEETSKGVLALTKYEFIEPDTLEYRYWCERVDDLVMQSMAALTYQIHLIQHVQNANGVRYSWFRADYKAKPTK